MKALEYGDPAADRPAVIRERLALECGGRAQRHLAGRDNAVIVRIVERIGSLEVRTRREPDLHPLGGTTETEDDRRDVGAECLDTAPGAPSAQVEVDVQVAGVTNGRRRRNLHAIAANGA